MKLFSRTLSLLSGGAVTLCVMFLAHRALEVSDARLYRPGVQKPHPEIWFGGSSNAGHHVAAEYVDVYLSWGEPPADVVAKLAEVRTLAAARGRTLRFGLRVHVIVRETEREASGTCFGKAAC